MQYVIDAGPSFELPEHYGAALWDGAMMKGLGHKYVKRVPKAGGGYRYFYHVAHGGGVAHEAHFVAGAAFQTEGGHFHITRAEGDVLHVRHDETGKEETLTKAELTKRLRAHHAAAIAAHAKRQELPAAVRRLAPAAQAEANKPKPEARPEVRPEPQNKPEVGPRLGSGELLADVPGLGKRGDRVHVHDHAQDAKLQSTHLLVNASTGAVKAVPHVDTYAGSKVMIRENAEAAHRVVSGWSKDGKLVGKRVLVVTDHSHKEGRPATVVSEGDTTNRGVSTRVRYDDGHEAEADTMDMYPHPAVFDEAIQQHKTEAKRLKDRGIDGGPWFERQAEALEREKANLPKVAKPFGKGYVILQRA